LYGPQAHRTRQDRVAEVLHKAPRGPRHASACTDEGRQARAIAGLLLRGPLGVEGVATPRPGALVSDAMGEVHLEGCVPPFTHGVFHRAVRLYNANHDSRTPYCNAHPAC